MDTAAIELTGVNLRFLSPDGIWHPTLRDLSLRVAPGEFVAVVGPTGCGKTSILNTVCGLYRPGSGRVEVMGAPVMGIDRRIGFVFQADALFPWSNVIDNVAAGPRYRGMPKKEAYQKAEDWLARVGLSRFRRHYPRQLSGGMRKRVALAQTLINEPAILLMDEPFSALDVQTRPMMHDELLRLWSSSGASVLFVTHDLEEAIGLADRVVVLTAGPATVKSVYAIDLPRPRSIGEIRYEPRFVEISRQIWNDLREEVLISRTRAREAA